MGNKLKNSLFFLNAMIMRGVVGIKRTLESNGKISSICHYHALLK